MAKLGPLPNAPGLVKVRYLYTWNSRPAYNVFYMRYSTTTEPTAADCLAVATGARNAWNSNLAALCTSAVQLTTTDCTSLATRTSPTASYGTVASGAVAVTNAAPANVALCASFSVSYRYRGGHARLYLPGQTTTTISNGNVWNAGWITTASSSFNAWFTAMNAITSGGNAFKLAMLSYYTHDSTGKPIYHPGGPLDYPITGIVIHSRVDTQRRRLGKETN